VLVYDKKLFTISLVFWVSLKGAFSLLDSMLARRAAHEALGIDSCFCLLVSYFHAHIIATQQKITRTKCVIKSENSSCFLARGGLQVPCQKCQGKILKVIILFVLFVIISNVICCFIWRYLKQKKNDAIRRPRRFP